MKRVLVYRHGGIGDTVLMSSVLQALRRRFPDLEITFAGHPGRVFLLDGSPNAHKVISSEDPVWRCLYRGAETTPGELFSFFRTFDRIVVYGSSTGERIRRLGSADNRLYVHPAIPPHGWECSAIRFYLKALEDLEIGGDIPNPAISCLPGDAFVPVDGEEEREFIVIHPGAGSYNKRFDMSWYSRIAKEIGGILSLEVIFMLGPAEMEMGWVQEIKKTEFAVAALSDLRAATNWLRRSACFIGNDAGMTHVSAALGIPTVAFFRGSDPRVWAPVGEEVLICDARQGQRLEEFLPFLFDFLGSALEAKRLCQGV